MCMNVYEYPSKILHMNLSPYGNIEIEKEECTNHVSKRMKKLLTQLAKDETLGKRNEKEGALTEEKITAFANFYGKAIKDNVGDTRKMRTAILASIFHHSKTPNYPNGIIHCCPKGENSWCFHAKKDPDFSKFTHIISYNVFKAITSSKGFFDLVSLEFLARCTGKTQNINESLHARVWKYVSKENFRNVRQVKIAMWLVMVKHNLGVLEQVGLLKDFGTPKRKKTSTKREKARQDYKPTVSKKIKKAKLDAQKRKRGRTDYVPGGGD
ncbi:UNVERIFIED_CONTAM: hypothetical protein RMT77_018828 [Armadillidium vulgare]